MWRGPHLTPAEGGLVRNLAYPTAIRTRCRKAAKYHLTNACDDLAAPVAVAFVVVIQTNPSSSPMRSAATSYHFAYPEITPRLGSDVLGSYQSYPYQLWK